MMNVPNVHEIDITTLPSVSFTQRRMLPTISAVYFARDHTGAILYVGQTRNLHLRWARHALIAALRHQQCATIAWYAASHEHLVVLETQWLHMLHPPLNGASARRVPNGKRINVYLDDDLWLSFRKQCLEHRLSASKVLTGLVEQFLAQHVSPAPEQRPPVARRRARQAAKAGTSA